MFENINQVGYDHQKVIPYGVISTENLDEIDRMVEFCLRQGYKLWIEEFVQTGKALGRADLSLDAEQRAYFENIAIQDCIKPKIHIVVSHDGYLKECKGIETPKGEEYSLIDKDGKVKDIFEMRHTLPDIVAVKYECFGRCYCEYVANQRKMSQK